MNINEALRKAKQSCPGSVFTGVACKWRNLYIFELAPSGWNGEETVIDGLVSVDAGTGAVDPFYPELNDGYFDEAEILAVGDRA